MDYPRRNLVFFVRIRHLRSKIAISSQNKIDGVDPVLDFEVENSIFFIFDANTVFSKSDNFLKICKSRDLECRKDM